MFLKDPNNNNVSEIFLIKMQDLKNLNLKKLPFNNLLKIKKIFKNKITFSPVKPKGLIKIIRKIIKTYNNTKLLNQNNNKINLFLNLFPKLQLWLHHNLH